MRSRLRTPMLATAVLAGVACLQTAGWAASIVKVQLQDSSVGNGMDGMRLVAEPSTVKAGPVTFQVSNQSHGLVHEMIVIKAPEDGKPLPYDAQADKVDEDGIHSLGEVSEREPGKDGTLTLNLAPGKYLLLCNQSSHYKGGMVASLTATP